MDKYSLGKCTICGKYTALKNNVCAECDEKDLPDFMKDIFGGFKNEKI